MNERLDSPGMDESPRHVIDAAIFELSLGRGIADVVDERALAGIVETELMPVVDEVFDERAATAEQVRIDTLEVDLGAVRLDSPWTAARERLREGLRSALALALPVHAIGTGDPHPAVPTGVPLVSDFDLAAYFLRVGTLPPRVQLRDGRRMDAILRDLLRAEPRRLGSLIRGAEGDGVATRLARQFPDPILGQIVGMLSPGRTETMVGLVRALKQAAGRIGPGAAWEGRVRETVWTRLLTNLAAGSATEDAPIARGLLEDAARGLGCSYREVVVELSDGIAGSGAASSLIRRLALDAEAGPTLRGTPVAQGGVNRDLAKDISSTPALFRDETEEHAELSSQVVSPKQRADGETGEAGQPGQHVTDGIPDRRVGPDVSSKLFESGHRSVGFRLDQLLEELEFRQPEELDWLLQGLRSGDILLSKVSDQLSTAALRRLLEGIQTAAGGAWDTSTLRMAIGSHAQRARDERGFYQRVLERLVNAELIDLEAIAEGSASPDGRSKARDGAPRDVARDTTGQRSTGGGAEAVGADGERALGLYLPEERLVPGGDREHLMQLAETGKLNSVAAGAALALDQVPPAQSTGKLRSLDEDSAARLAELLGETAASASQAASRWAGVIDEVARTHPDRLRRLFFGLQSGAINLTELTGGLGGSALRSLVQAFLRLTVKSADADRSQFARAIDEHAGRAGSKQGFYRRVLERLVGDELIDLEAIAAGSEPLDAPARSQVSAPQGAARGAGEAAAIRGETHAANENAEGALRIYLQEGRVVPGSDRGQLMQVAEGLLARAPHRFDGLVRQSLQWEGAVARLVELLPERLLKQALFQLAPAIHERVQRYADAVVSVCRDRGIGIDGERMAGLKWRFCLQYLLSPNPDPDAALFVPAFIGYLDAHAARFDAGERDAALRLSLAGIEPLSTHGGGEAPAADLAASAQPTGQLRSGSDDPSAWLAGLLGETAGAAAPGRLAALIDEVARTHPDRLRRLFSGLKSGAINLTELTGGVAGSALRALVQAFLRLMATSPEVDRSQLAQSIDEHAGRAGSERGFYRQVLERLVGDELIDLEAIAADSEPLREQPEPRGARARCTVGDSKERVPAGDDLAAELEAPRVSYPWRDREALERGILIANAGQVIAAPYLPRLFGVLGLVDRGVFKGPEARERAVHLLQFMVDGSQDTPEYELVLNKLLCGLDVAIPVSRGCTVADGEKRTIEGLLQGMIQNWKALGRTSVSGFRESFLRRDGTLRCKDDGWHLSVEPRAFDMLLDRIPWGFSPIKHPWMDEVVHVVWR